MTTGIRAWGVFAGALAAVLAHGEAALAEETPPAADIGQPAPPAEAKPADLPPVEAGAWGVGGKDEEGQYAPKGKTGALKEEAEDKTPIVLGPPGSVSLDTVIGFGKIRVVTDDSNPTSVTVVSFLASGSYRLGDVWALGVRLPISTGSTTGPLEGVKDDYSTFAIGNLELAVRPTFAMSNRLRVPLAVAISLPLASGDLFAVAEDQGAAAQAVVNQAASSSRGWEETALFASKRVGFTPSAGLLYDRNALHLGVSTKLDIMKKTGGNDPPKELLADEQGALQDPNTTWVTGVSGAYDFMDGKVTPMLRAWLAVATVPVRTGVSREYSGPQLVMEPAVRGKLPVNAAKTMFAAGTLGFVLPVGGHLGGANEGSVTGVRIRAELLF